MNENGHCLYPGCETSIKLAGGGRGLCGKHYQRAHHLVKSGRVTWDQLEAGGKSKASHTPHAAKENSWFLEGVK